MHSLGEAVDRRSRGTFSRVTAWGTEVQGQIGVP
jgi:hypothetical protein